MCMIMKSGEKKEEKYGKKEWEIGDISFLSCAAINWYCVPPLNGWILVCVGWNAHENGLRLLLVVSWSDDDLFFMWDHVKYCGWVSEMIWGEEKKMYKLHQTVVMIEALKMIIWTLTVWISCNLNQCLLHAKFRSHQLYKSHYIHSIFFMNFGKSVTFTRVLYFIS